MSVNLLPTSLLPSPGVQKIIKIFRNINSLLIVTFVVMAVGFSIVYGYSYNNKRNLNSQNDELLVQIKALEDSEQSLYLLRDRIAKIQRIDSTPTLTKRLEQSRDLTSFVPEEVTIEFLDVTPQAIRLGVTAPSSDVISDFLEKMQTLAVYDNISMDTFNFNQSLGFTAEFTLN